MVGIGQLTKELIWISSQLWKASRCFQIPHWSDSNALILHPHLSTRLPDNILTTRTWCRIFRNPKPAHISTVIKTGGAMLWIYGYIPLSHLFKSLLLFWYLFAYHYLDYIILETTDTFPTFLSLNTLIKNPYLTKGTLGTCSKCIRNFPHLASHI